MPQVDLESLVSACAGGASDRKIACETTAGADRSHDRSDLPEDPPDFPPDSFWLSRDEELGWFDRNAFYERKSSAKGYPSSTNLNPHLTHSTSVSQRFSLPLKSKASIIGLPKPQKACFSDAKLRRNIKPRLFPKRSSREGKSAVVSLAEPSSPKVSCMGRVRSKKDRSRRCKNRPRGPEPAAIKKEKTGRKRRTKLWRSLTGIFRSGGGAKPAGPRDGEPESPPPRRESRRASRSPGASPTCSGAVDAPGLGEAKRFTSGRRSDSWLESACEESGKSGNSDGDAVWARRGVPSLEGVDCRRGWGTCGPASV